MILEAIAAIDDQVIHRMLPEHRTLANAQSESRAGGMPVADISPTQGKLLFLLARMARAKRILEVGSLGAQATLWLARALPGDGLLITLRDAPLHAAIARMTVEQAALGGRVFFPPSSPIEMLQSLAREEADFDFVFIGMPMRVNRDYLPAALRLARPGAVVVVKHALRRNMQCEGAGMDEAIQSSLEFVEVVSGKMGEKAIVLQTFGVSGWDEFAVGLVCDSPD